MKKYSKMVTICITSLNRGDYIKRCIDSVVNQTYTNLQIVILDGGSTDNTLSIIKSYKDPRIKLFIDKVNLGQVLATQSAYDKAQGDYIGSVDSDDWIEPNCVERCMDTIGDAGLVYTQCRWESGRFDHRSNVVYTKETLLDYFMVFHFRLFRAELWRRVRPFSVEHYCWDYDLVLKLSEVTDFVHLPEVLYYWRHHNEHNPRQVNIDYKRAQVNARLRRL